MLDTFALDLILAASLVGLVKTLLVTLIAVLNAVLSMLASIAVWKSYLAVGAKVAFILVLCVPVVGVVWYLAFGQKRVRDARR
ncbi:MAG: hypothetical protein AAFN13_13250 [Bacteroidota bacterium]